MAILQQRLLVVFALAVVGVQCISLPQVWVQTLQLVCTEVDSNPDVLGPPIARDIRTFPSVAISSCLHLQFFHNIIIPNVILWSPCEQFSLVMFSCPKCSDHNIEARLSPIDWTNGQTSPRLPRLIYSIDSNILLISRVYRCSNDHVTLGHHPDMIRQLYRYNLESSIPFALWHQCGFTVTLLEHIQQSIASGTSLQECESFLAENRLRNYYLQVTQVTQIANCAGKAVADLHIVDGDTIDILKQSPSRNAIKGCFLFKFGQSKPIIHCQMRQTTMPPDKCWLSCDHTFHTVANIGLFREEDGVWSKQYEGLFCVLNSDGEVLSWKATKSLSFNNVQEMLLSLQKRLTDQGKQVKEFIIDNCCSWRNKLQSIFGCQMRVSLDIFHAVQNV